MREDFHGELLCLHSKLQQMGELCYRAIREAIETLRTGRCPEAARATEIRIDGKEEEIGSLCLRLLLLQQPVAGDLRLISATMKLISDLERIGDQCADIGELAATLPPHRASAFPTLDKMAEQVVKMLRDSIDALLLGDSTLAKQVQQADDTVDACFLELRRQLLHQIHAFPEQSDPCLDLFMIAKYLERIGDHTVNVAEWTEFALTGHHPRSDL